MSDKRPISKSAYLIYRQCPKYFWYYINDRKSIPEHDQRAKFNFKIGHITGNLAKLCYSDGVDASCNRSIEENIQRTKQLLGLGRPVFEAGFLAEAGKTSGGAPLNIYARADILVPVDCTSAWDIIEVKSSTGVKAINLADVAFQKYCYTQAGLNIRNCYVMHINSSYVRNGRLDPYGIFRLADVTEEADKIMPHIKNDLNQMAAVMASERAPSTGVGKYCDSPFNCPLKIVCWENISDSSIFYLYSLTKKIARRMAECGIEHIYEIPESFSGINPKQKIQIECVKKSENWIDRAAINEFIKEIEYPLYFLDFETFASPFPLIEGTRPYQAIPFQFSLHIVETPESKPCHHSFLADGKSDPRQELSAALRENFGFAPGDDGRLFKGSVVVYNESVERALLKDLAAFDTANAGWIFRISSRIVDLFDPFKNFYFYSVRQKGSASVKKVLPALTEKSYSEMAISNGDIANITFLSGSAMWKDFIAENNLETINVTGSRNYNACDNSENDLKACGNMEDEKLKYQTRENLEQYCKLDTEGMYHILEKLKELVRNCT
jgi:hypothetical protein